MVRTSALRSPAAVGLALALGALVAGCPTSGSSSPHTDGQTGSKVRIDQPTTATSIVVHEDTIELGGTASIDAWSYAMEVEPNVRWINQTTGAAGEAYEHVDWSVFPLFYPSNHTWSATVPLVPGPNDVLVEAYYATSGTVVGSDSIRVTLQ